MPPTPSPGVTITVQALLFDMDGTLIDSSPAIARSWGTWAARWTDGGTFTHSDHGRPARDIVADQVPANRVDEAFAFIEGLEIADTADITALPGALALIDSLPADRWAIVTSCSAPLARARVAAVGLAPGVLVTASDTAQGKPQPDPYLLGAQRLGFDARSCLVVEDAPTGLAAGRAAGCVTLAVHGTAAPEHLDADYVVASLDDVRVTVTSAGLQVLIRTSP